MTLSSPFDVPVDEKPVASLARRAWSPIDAVLPRRGQILVFALVIVAVGTLARSRWTLGSWLSGRDFGYIATATLDEPGADRALLIPGVLIDLAASNGFEWSGYAAQIIVLQALAGLACLVMLWAVFGPRPLILVPLAWYLLTPLTLPASLSWSVAVHHGPAHIALFIALAATAAWLRRGQPGVGVLAVVAYAVGLLSDPGGVVILVPILVLMGRLAGPSHPPGRRRRPLVLGAGLFSVTAVAVGWRLTSPAPFSGDAPARDLGDGLAAAVTGLAGGPWTWTWSHAPVAEASPPLFWVLGAGAGLAALVVLAVRARPAAAWSLLGWVVTLAAVLALVRLDPGVTLGASPSDMATYGAWAVAGAMFLGGLLLPFRGERGPEGTRPSRFSDPSPWPPIVACAAALFVLSTTVSGVRFAEPWQTTTEPQAFPERVYVDTVTATLDDNDLWTPIVLDTVVPPWVRGTRHAPDDRLSRFLAPLRSELTVVSSGIDVMMLDDRGRVGPAHIASEPNHGEPPVPDCGFLVQREPVTVPLTPTTAPDPWIAIDYLASADGLLDVYVGGELHEISIRSGLGLLWLPVDADPGSITLGARGDLTVCASAIRVGAPSIRTEEVSP